VKKIKKDDNKMIGKNITKRHENELILTIVSIIIFLILIMIVNITLSNSNKQNNDKTFPATNILSDKENYKKYKDLYEDAKYKEDYDLITSALKKYIEYAMKLNKTEVAIWQYNNLAYYNIMEFCYRTDYGNKKDIIYKMKNGEAKDKYIEEFKKILLSEYLYIEKANKNILQAYILNSESKETNEQRTKYMKNNLHFIDEINKFLEIK
jgi:nitrogen fixation-related uncharacterized protein